MTDERTSDGIDRKKLEEIRDAYAILIKDGLGKEDAIECLAEVYSAGYVRRALTTKAA